MRNPNRPVFIVCFAAAMLLIVVVALADVILIRNFERIEADLARESIGRIRNALLTDLRQLEIATRDYAHWDETYRFLRGDGNPSFIDTTFRNETLESLQIDVVWMVRGDGTDVYYLMRGEAGEMSLPAPLLNELRVNLGDVKRAVAVEPMNRLLQLHGLLAEVSVQPILRTDRSGPSVGHLVFVRLLQRDDIARIAEMSRLPVSILPLDSPAAYLRLPQEVRVLLASDPPPREADFWVARDEANLSGFAILHDVHGRMIASLITSIRRDVMLLGRHTAASFIAVTAILVLSFIAVVLVLVTRLSRSSRARRLAERQLQTNRRKLSRLSEHDALTGLPNRHFLQSRLPRRLVDASRSGSPVALLYIDIDNFKHINDSSGHGSGDGLLRVIAHRLKETASRRDLVARMGGDEFVIVASGLADRAAVETLAERLMLAVSAPIEQNHTQFSLTVSMGVSMYPEDGRDVEGLLKHADIALYQAKDRGRNNYQLFAPDMNVRLMERVALEQALRRAIGTQELFLEYQPIVDIPGNCIIAVEALLRWQHPELGLVPPSRFIPIAESCGVIGELGEYVLRLACKQLSEWLIEGVPVVPICINVSPRQFERGRMQETVESVTREFGVDPSLLTFEITEGAVMNDIEHHLGTLHALRRLGARIAVDDFGTGYSSLSYLKHLPIDALKIDRAFVRDMAADSNDGAIVTAIVSMARSLGLRTIAEGVETEDQLERLRALGCDAAQGFHLDRPMPPRHCRARLEVAAVKITRSETIRRKALRIIRGTA